MLAYLKRSYQQSPLVDSTKGLTKLNYAVRKRNITKASKFGTDISWAKKIEQKPTSDGIIIHFIYGAKLSRILDASPHTYNLLIINRDISGPPPLLQYQEIQYYVSCNKLRSMEIVT